MLFQTAIYHMKAFYYAGRHFEIFINSADMPSKTVIVFHLIDGMFNLLSQVFPP